MRQVSKKAIHFFNKFKVAPLFPDSPEGNLWAAVTELAVHDYFSNRVLRDSAVCFFTRDDSVPAGIINIGALFEQVKRLEE